MDFFGFIGICIGVIALSQLDGYKKRIEKLEQQVTKLEDIIEEHTVEPGEVITIEDES